MASRHACSISSQLVFRSHHFILKTLWAWFCWQYHSYIYICFLYICESENQLLVFKYLAYFPFCLPYSAAFCSSSWYWGNFAASMIREGFVVASVGLYFFITEKMKVNMWNPRYVFLPVLRKLVAWKLIARKLIARENWSHEIWPHGKLVAQKLIAKKKLKTKVSFNCSTGQ